MGSRQNSYAATGGSRKNSAAVGKKTPVQSRRGSAANV